MECWNAVDAAWLSIITLLVALQGFSFAIYQAGARPCHSSNLHVLFVYAVINFTVGSILWYFVGYSLSFGPSQNGLIGSLDDAFFLGVSGSKCSVHADSVPGILFASFEMMLAVIAPLMLLSAWVDQMNILGALIIYLLWPIFVYYPLTHWIRGEGWLHQHFGIVDQSGSLTIHASTGSSALVFTKVFNGVHENQTHKQDHKKEHVHFLNVYLLAGGLVTSLGWYCTNVGSVHKFNSAAILSLVNSDLSVCASLLSWLIVMYLTKRNYRMTDLLQGIIVGLVGVSASSGSIELWASMIIGLIVGVISSVVSWSVQKYQPLWTSTGMHDITYIHGVPGILGAVTAGLFTKSSKDVASENGAFYSNGAQLGVQLLGVVVTTTWSVIWTYLLIWLIRITVGLNSGNTNKMFGACDTAKSLPSSVMNSEREVLRKKLFKVAAKGDLQELDNLLVQQVSFGVQDFDKRTPLHVACVCGNLNCVKFLLRQPGVDIHARDRWKASPLSEAVQFGHDQVVQCLLRHGAGWCEDGVGDLLCSAIVKNDVEELQRLVSLGVDVNAPNEEGSTALHVAAAVGSRGVVQYLTDNKADINAVDSLGNTPLNYSNMHEHRAVSQLLEGLGARRLSHHYSMHEVCEVASTGNLQMLRHMVHNGATVCYRDFNKRTPLHISAAEGHLDVVKFLLLQPGININARDTNDFSPLLDAIVNGHHGVVQYLKACGGTISECKLASLMTSAASTGDTRTMKRLIRWAGHVNVSDFNGQTALHMAAMCGRLNVVNLLLKEGADATLVNRYGQIPLQIATANGHKAVEKELRKQLKLTEEIILTDQVTTITCYSPEARRRGRKSKTDRPQYSYSKRPSRSSTENSLELQQYCEHSVNSIHTSRELINPANVRAPLKGNDISQLPILNVNTHAISGLTAQAREMTGGQPDYV